MREDRRGTGRGDLSEREDGSEMRSRQGHPESKPRARGQAEGPLCKGSGGRAAAISRHVPVPPVHSEGMMAYCLSVGVLGHQLSL